MGWSGVFPFNIVEAGTMGFMQSIVSVCSVIESRHFANASQAKHWLLTNSSNSHQLGPIKWFWHVIIPLSGITRIGSGHPRQPQDIVIQGTGVQQQHCYILNDHGAVFIHPLAILCSVDGSQITHPTQLTQGNIPDHYDASQPWSWCTILEHYLRLRWLLWVATMYI